MQVCSPAEKKVIDKMIDSGPQLAGTMEYNVVLSKYLILCCTVAQIMRSCCLPLLAKRVITQCLCFYSVSCYQCIYYQWSVAFGCCILNWIICEKYFYLLNHVWSIFLFVKPLHNESKTRQMFWHAHWNYYFNCMTLLYYKNLNKCTKPLHYLFCKVKYFNLWHSLTLPKCQI